MIPRRRLHFDARAPALLARSVAKGTVLDGPDRESFIRDAVHSVEYPGAPRPVAVATSSGRNALARLLKALSVPPGGTVLIPAYTLGSLVPFLEALGHPVRFCDVEQSSPIMSLRTVKAAWTGDVVCVLITHLFGHAAEVDEIAKFARARRAVVLEDCAHAWGTRLDGEPVGARADGALFSLDAVKTVHAFGGGVAMLTDTAAEKRLSMAGTGCVSTVPAVLWRLAAGGLEGLVFQGPWLRVPSGLLAFEQTRRLVERLDSIIRRGSPSPNPGAVLSNLQAAIARLHLETLQARMQRRRYVARRVLDALELDDPALDEDAATRSNAYFVVVRAAPREDARSLRRELWLQGIDAGVGTEVADNASDTAGVHCVHAADWYARAIQLPCFEDMTNDILEKLTRRLRNFRGRFVR